MESKRRTEEYLFKHFWELTLEYTCSKVTSYNKDDLVAKDMKYEIVKREGNLLEIKYHVPELLGGTNTKRITLVGDCYYLPLEHFTFSEVFCREKKRLLHNQRFERA